MMLFNSMKKRFHVINVSPVKQETLSAKEFLRLSTDSPHLIAGSRYVAPAIGRHDFGRFEVRYTVPILKHKEIA